MKVNLFRGQAFYHEIHRCIPVAEKRALELYCQDRLPSKRKIYYQKSDSILADAVLSHLTS